MITKEKLVTLYLNERYSVSEIADTLGCSQGKVNYWLAAYRIQKRSISDAVYQRYNPSGDPFLVKSPVTIREAMLFGLGVGLYWGEGTKSNKTTVRLGNTDPRLIVAFIHFLEVIYSIDKKKLRFGLQIFSDMSPQEALKFWQKYLKVSQAQFQKVVVTPARSLGTYRNKTRYGVLTVYFNNRKLRDIICRAVEDIDVLLGNKPK